MLARKIGDIEKIKKRFSKDIEKLEKIKEKISKKTDLDDSEKKFLEMHLYPIELEKKPPFSIMNLLHYCWSFTLNLSGKETQKKLGEKFTDNFLGILKRYRSSKLDTDKPVLGSLLVNERFVNDLVGSLGKTIRNIGFVKDVHDRKLDDLEKELVNKTSFYDDLSKFASVSKEGLGSKIATFVGGGSLITLTKNFEFLQRGDVEAQFTHLTKLYNLVPDNQTKAQILTKLIELAEVGQPTVSNFDILLFVLAGVGFMVGLTITIKLLRHRAVSRLFKITREKQQEYWRDSYRPEVAEYITEFYLDVKSLIQKYYRQNANEILKEFWNEMQREQITKDSSITQIQEPTTQEIQKFIEERILPHYWLEHQN